MAQVSSSSSRNSAAAPNMPPEVSRDLLAELNNEGAFLLEHGEHSAAIKVLTQALNVAMRDVGCSEFLMPDEEEDLSDTESVVSRGSAHHRRSSRHHHQQQSKQAEHSHSQRRSKPKRSQRSRSRRAYVHSTSRTVRDDKPSITQDKILSPVETNFVYSKPLRVADRYALPSFVELTLYVVYNLAVAYHLRVLKRRRKGQTRILREILRLYKLAHSIQAREEIGLEPTYTLSLWNNLGQAYKSLGKDEKADVCFSSVLTNIVCMIDHGCATDVDHLNKFLDNVAHILTPVKHYADAA